MQLLGSVCAVFWFSSGELCLRARPDRTPVPEPGRGEGVRASLRPGGAGTNRQTDVTRKFFVRVDVSSTRQRDAAPGAEADVLSGCLHQSPQSQMPGQPSMRVTVTVASVCTPGGSAGRPMLGEDATKTRKRALAAEGAMTSRTTNFPPMFCVALAPM